MHYKGWSSRERGNERGNPGMSLGNVGNPEWDFEGRDDMRGKGARWVGVHVRP